MIRITPKQYTNKELMGLFVQFKYMMTLRNKSVESNGTKFRDRLTNEIVAEFKPITMQPPYTWVAMVYYTGKPKRVQTMAKKLEALLKEQGHNVRMV